MNSDMETARNLAKALRVAWCPGSSAIEQDYEMIAAALRAARSEALEEAVRLREALEPFVPDETTAAILWRDLPDWATGTITVKLADFRRARAALDGTKEMG